MANNQNGLDQQPADILWGTVSDFTRKYFQDQNLISLHFNHHIEEMMVHMSRTNWRGHSLEN